MQADDKNVELASLIEPERIASYARVRGWVAVPGKQEEIQIFGRPAVEERYDQLLIPASVEAQDYPQRVLDAVRRIASFENQQPAHVLSELTMPPSDVLRYRLADYTTKNGTVSFERGFDLLKGAERSLRAAACSVIKAEKYYPRLSRTESDELVQAARIGQTEIGSYVTLVYVPLDAVKKTDKTPGQLGLTGVLEPDPFARRTTLHLMAAVEHITKSIHAGEPERLEEPTSSGLQISANLCEALLEMQPQSFHAHLQISARLDPTVTAAKAVNLCVSIPQVQFEAIEKVAARLRPAHVPARTAFIGTVVALMGQPNEKGTMEGKITLQFQHEDELLRAHLSLTADDYQVAVDAHRRYSFVQVYGYLQRQARMHLIYDYTEFRVLQHDLFEPTGPSARGKTI